MALEDVYFPIAANPKIFAISTNVGGGPDDKESKSKTVTLDNVPVGGQLTFSFDTKDSIANNGLQGTFELSSGNSKVEFFSEKLERVVSKFKIPEEPTVQGEYKSETHTITVRLAEAFKDAHVDNVSVRIDFNGTVEVLDAGFDEYSLISCCPCEAFPYIDDNGCERFCTCPPPAPCDNDTDCPCNKFCDTTFFENPIYKNGEGECTAGCETSLDCCIDGENDFRCVHGKCEIATECPCPEGQKCVNKKCEDDPDDPDDPDGDGCGPDKPCPAGFECINGECVETDDPDPPKTGTVYMMSQKKRVALSKSGFFYSDIIGAGNGTLDGIFTDQTIVFRRYKTVDVDEGCTTAQGTYYGECGSQKGEGFCDINNIGGAVNTQANFKQAFMRVKGTNYNPPDALVFDEGQFDTPYRSSVLETKLRSKILGMSYDNFNGYPKNNILRQGAFDTNCNFSTQANQTVRYQTDVSSSYGTDGYIERLTYYFVKKIETSTASSKTYVTDEEKGDPITISSSNQFDSISISQKDSYVGGRTSNENFVNGQGGDSTIQWLTTPYDTRIVNKPMRSPSGTVYNKKVQEKIVITQVYETSLPDNVATSSNITGGFSSADFGTPDHLFTLAPDQGDGYCKTYKDCNQGQDCRNNRCVNTLSQPCQNNSDCPDGQKCKSGKCVGTLDKDCNSPSDCPKGAKCVNGKCTTGLGDNDDGEGGGGGDNSTDVHDDPNKPNEATTEEENEKEQEQAQNDEPDPCPGGLSPIPNAVTVI